MREIAAAEITAAIRGLFAQACLCPGSDVLAALKQARQEEESPQGREILRQLLENADVARQEDISQSCHMLRKLTVYTTTMDERF